MFVQLYTDHVVDVQALACHSDLCFAHSSAHLSVMLLNFPCSIRFVLPEVNHTYVSACVTTPNRILVIYVH